MTIANGAKSWGRVSDAPPPQDPAGQSNRMKYEYITILVQPISFYSVPVCTHELGDDDVHMADRATETFVQAVSVEHGHNRLKTVRTLLEDRKEDAKLASVALNIQCLEVWARRSPTSVTVFLKQIRSMSLPWI